MIAMKQNLDVGAVLSRVFDLYTKHLGALLGLGAIIFIPLGIIEGVLNNSGSVVLSLIGTIVSLVGTYIFIGAVVRLVEDVQDGTLDSSVGTLISSIMPVLFTLILVGIIASIGIGVGLVLCIVPGLFLLTFWAVVSPLVVVENAGVGQAFSRSWELVKGNAWQVFAVILLFFLLQAVVGAIFVVIARGISDAVFLTIIVSILVRLALAPLSALAGAVIYFELVAAQSAVPAVADPAYPPPPPPPPPAAPPVV
jgi:hypothetical protein